MLRRTEKEVDDIINKNNDKMVKVINEKFEEVDEWQENFEKAIVHVFNKIGLGVIFYNEILPNVNTGEDTGIPNLLKRIIDLETITDIADHKKAYIKRNKLGN